MKNLLSGIGSIFGSLFHEYGGGLLTVISAGVLLSVNNMLEDSVPIANFIVSWGMVIIVGYGVLRIVVNILWKLLFGKSFEWKRGLLESLFNRLRPVRAQMIAEATDEEIEEKALHYMRKLRRVRIMKKHGGVRKMSAIKTFLSSVNANKNTILGIGTILAGGILSATGIIDPTQALNLASGSIEAIAATGTLGAMAVLGIKAAMGKGIESPEAYAIRKAEEAKVKAQDAELKASGVMQAEQTTKKLVKQLGIPEAKAKEIVAMQLAGKQELFAAQKVEEDQAKAKKLAKKLGISEAKAAEIVKEME